MLRYNLRTLLILTAFAAILFARIGYLQRMAHWHRQRVAEVLPLIAESAGVNSSDAAKSVWHLTQKSDGVKAIVFEQPFQEIVVLESTTGNGLVIQNRAALAHWDTAIHHSVLAARYDRATYRPWVWVNTNTAK